MFFGEVIFESLKARLMSDDWDFYFCQVDHKPASLFVDLGLRPDVPMPNLSDLVWVRLRLRHPRPDGLSSDEEFDRLSEIEDALASVDVGQDAELIYVGRNTSNGHRDFCYYTSNAHQAQSCLSQAMVAYNQYEFEIGSRPDADWSTYLEFLYPSDREHQMILNGRTLQSLEKHGDRHEIEREVCHWVYFKSADDRTCFVTAAKDKGYKLLGESEKEAGQFGANVARVDAIDYNTINSIVLELFDLATKTNGEYDGWETSVETGESE